MLDSDALKAVTMSAGRQSLPLLYEKMRERTCYNLRTLLLCISAKGFVHEVPTCRESERLINIVHTELSPIADGARLDALENFVQSPFSFPKVCGRAEAGCEHKGGLDDQVRFYDVRRGSVQDVGERTRVSRVGYDDFVRIVSGSEGREVVVEVDLRQR